MNPPVLKLIIIEDNEEFLAFMSNRFRKMEQFELVGTARDGDTGLALIQSTPADVAVIDLVMPNKDGFYVLEALSRQPEQKPICVVLSGIGLDFVTARAVELGADYFVMKPFDFDLLARRITEVWQHKHRYPPLVSAPSVSNLHTEKKNVTDFVISILHGIPVSHSLLGYEYLKTAILMVVEDGTMLDGVTKRLYPAIAKQFKTSGPRVERAIRHAIHSAWEKGGGGLYAEMLGQTGMDMEKPTNSRFIAAVAEYYHRTFS